MILEITNAIAKTITTVAKTTNAIAEITNEFAKITNTIAEITMTLAKMTNAIAKSTTATVCVVAREAIAMPMLERYRLGASHFCCPRPKFLSLREKDFESSSLLLEREGS
jgi:hypothetical protein